MDYEEKRHLENAIGECSLASCGDECETCSKFQERINAYDAEQDDLKRKRELEQTERKMFCRTCFPDKLPPQCPEDVLTDLRWHIKTLGSELQRLGYMTTATTEIERLLHKYETTRVAGSDNCLDILREAIKQAKNNGSLGVTSESIISRRLDLYAQS